MVLKGEKIIISLNRGTHIYKGFCPFIDTEVVTHSTFDKKKITSLVKSKNSRN